MIRVFLVDDSAFVRRALTRVLALEPEFRVVGEAASGTEALAKIPAADPDLVTSAPHTAPVRRLDEATAARQPNLRWRKLA